ncbi:hypothetical protein ATANTOWER_014352 [Ataeniobius toweri]|uniref:Uncharacterized protein n=1 Tax=Ataeniobius toweri TaxID=208326 RepID=A0ABU7AXU5_9TELE|nr:hypothetical protein [Ataeniobius toweri]
MDGQENKLLEAVKDLKLVLRFSFQLYMDPERKARATVEWFTLKPIHYTPPNQRIPVFQSLPLLQVYCIRFGVEKLPWSAQSPDFNLLKQLFKYLLLAIVGPSTN